MNRAEQTEGAGSGPQSLEAPSGATEDSGDPVASTRETDEQARTRRLQLPIRVVGHPMPPEAERDPTAVALRALPVAGVNRRRMAWLVGIAVSLWVVAVFARQVGQASAAGDRADQVRADNAALATQVAALQHERDVVQQQTFIQFQARAYGLGTAQEQRFTLAANAPALPPDAPGSASLRLAPEPTPQTPLDAWLALLFGPGR
jgi:hypothetical protein